MSNHYQQSSEILCQILSPFQSLESTLEHNLAEDEELWKQLIQVASKELLLPSVYPALKEKCTSLSHFDQELLEFLQAAQTLNDERNALLKTQILHFATLPQLQTSLRQPLLLLKGACHLFTTSAFPHSRVIGDIDLLLDQEDLYRAVAAAIATGYKNSEEIWYYDHFRTQHYPPLYHPEHTAVLELHEHLVSRHLSPSIPYAIVAQRSTQLEECPALLPDPSMRVLHTMLHALIGESGFYHNHLSLRQLHDFCLISSSAEIDWQWIRSHFKGIVSQEMFRYYLLQAEKFFGWHPPQHLRIGFSLSTIVRERSANRPLLHRAIDLSFSTLGTLSAERIQSHYCATGNSLQLQTFRLQHLAHLVRKFCSRKGRISLLRTAKEGTVGMGTHTDSSQVRNFALIPLDESALLLNCTSGMSVVVNSSASTIAQDLLEGVPRTTLAENISREAGIAYEHALGDVQSIEQLLKNFPKPEKDKSFFTRSHSALQAEINAKNFAKFACTTQYLSPTMQLACHTTAEYTEVCTAALDALTPVSECTQHPRLRNLYVEQREGQIWVTADSAKALCCKNPRMLPSLLYSHIQRLLAEELTHSLAVHGAGYYTENSAVLLLGDSGSGKSTLLAGLVQEKATDKPHSNQQVEIIADDLLLFDHSIERVYKLPIPYAIKEGAWNIPSSANDAYLESIHPKGIAVRFYSHSTSYQAELSPIVRAIVFPKYDPEGRSSSKRLSPSEAMHEIAASGFFIPDKRQEQTITAFIERLQLTELRRISYRTLEEAKTFLAELSLELPEQ